MANWLMKVFTGLFSIWDPEFVEDDWYDPLASV